MLREILINVAQKEKRVALLEDKTLQEFYIEREDSRGIFGNIYKGKVKTIMPGMGAAFVDLGLKKDGFLYVSDIVALPTEYGEINSASLRQRPGGKRGKKEDRHPAVLVRLDLAGRAELVSERLAARVDLALARRARLELRVPARPDDDRHALRARAAG